MSDKPEVLSCVLIPVQQGTLLLPNVSIAEIVDYTDPEPVAGAPAWLMGQLPWRGMRLPVISYDAANGGEAAPPVSLRGRVAVLNTIGDSHGKLPFLAIVTQGIPRQAKIDDSALVPLDQPPGPADIMVVEFEGEPAAIPNLEYLEQLAAEANAA